MRPDDKDKLNKCLEILDTTDLGLSMVWLWTWSTIDNLIKDDSYKANVTMDQMWEHLSEAVSAGKGFSLEYGAEQHQEDVIEWMINNDYITDPYAEEEYEDELDTDDLV